MGDKATLKRQYIIEAARKVFMEKGYKNVTMKDIVEACEISRGGLYMYFSSTKDIFSAVMQLEAEESDDVFRGSISKDATPADVFVLFLKEQKKEIVRKENTLTVAIYEYFFENKIAKKDNVLRNQFDMASKVIESLIVAGIDSGGFFCEEPAAMARNIMFEIEGMKIASQTMGISERMISEEMLFIVKSLAVED